MISRILKVEVGVYNRSLGLITLTETLTYNNFVYFSVLFCFYGGGGFVLARSSFVETHLFVSFSLSNMSMMV